MIDKNMKILVVDDFSTMRKVMRNMLNQLGFKNIAEAEDGTVALRMLKNNNFNFVITDWNMPNMSGYDLLKLIRTDALLADTPVLLVTAEAEKENIIKAAQAGVNDYISKPFTKEILSQKFDKIFS